MRNITLIFIFFLSAELFAQTKLPSVELLNMNDEKVISTEVIKTGKPYAICFWAVWNKTSLLELNILMEKYKDWHDQYGVSLYAICVDEKDRFPRAKAYVEAHEWKYNVLFDEQGNLEKKMNINGVPHLMLFDKEGKVVWQEHSYDRGVETIFLNEVHKLK